MRTPWSSLRLTLALAVGCCAPCATVFAQVAAGLAPPGDSTPSAEGREPAHDAAADAPGDAETGSSGDGSSGAGSSGAASSAPSEVAPGEGDGTDESAFVDPDADPDAIDPDPAVSVDPNDFDAAEQDLGRTRALWVLDDGVDLSEVPWDDFDPGAEYTPRGAIHLGVQLRVGALPGGAMPLPDGPLIELGGILDGRYSPASPWHLRVVLAASFQPPGDENLGAGVHSMTSPFALKVRLLPISVDLEQWGALRAGAEIGVQYLPQLDGDGEWEMLPGFSGEAVVRALDGLLEIGVFGGIQWTAMGRTTRSGFSWRLELEGVIGVSAGYLLF